MTYDIDSVVDLDDAEFLELQRQAREDQIGGMWVAAIAAVCSLAVIGGGIVAAWVALS